MAIGVDPLRASDRRVGALGRDGGTCAQVPDALAEGIGSEAAVPDNPSGHIRQTAEQPRRKGQLMRSAKATARPRPSAITQAFVP